MTAYAELEVTSNYSFLRGASHPDELVVTAKALGLAALGIADRNTLAGVVRAHVAAKEAGLKLLVGARLAPEDGPEVLCYPSDRAAYGRLCRLLTLGKRRASKGACRFTLAELGAHGEGQALIVLPPEVPDKAFRAALARLGRRFPGACFLAGQALYRGDDARRLARLAELARACATPLVATNDVRMHAPARKALLDVLTCIRERCTIDEAGFRLEANAERHLKPPEEMARLFRDHPGALARTREIAERCRFSLDELRYEYPDEATGAGRSAQEELEHLTRIGASARYPDGVPGAVEATLDHELRLIGELGYAPYFLTVHDIVRFARSRGILCQGRGSAANSAVCYCLGITAVDPARVDLLFERFVSAERGEPPDIDVDFEHERREEVIQYIYAKYGRERAGLAATVICYRTRGAVREVGKAMGLSADTISALSGLVWGWSREGVGEGELRALGLDPGNRRLRLTLDLVRELIGFPRHLSQHVGGFVMTRGRLDELVPIENAAMPERTVIEWDKDDLDALGILKVDVLGLGMLTCLRKGFDLLAQHTGERHGLASVPAEDAQVYDMLCKADSLGVFQVESRAQMSMLPRLKPRGFYDLVIEVAIVRPGPIQGDMVHPYLR
ncbi:MAG: PHP domain-containing protein, partial [Kiloniellaceae bacterium]